jgi:hypothetical protein
MSKHRAARRNPQIGDVVGLAGATLAAAAATAIGIGASQTDGSTLAHRVSAFVRLLSGPSDTGVDAFTLGPYTFDPYTSPLGLGLLPSEGWTTFPAPVFPGPPVFNISGGNLDGLALASQDFEVFNSSGQEVGTVDTAGTILQVLGENSYEFTVTSSTPVLLGSAANLPAVGTVYDIFNGYFAGIPNGLFDFQNVYEATPSGTVSDYVVLPNGTYNLADPIPVPQDFTTLNLSGLLTQNFAQDLQPGDAFSNLATSADASIGSNAFTINVPGFDYTLDPVSTLLASNTYNAVTPLAGFPPLFAAGGADFVGISVDTQGFDVYNTGGTEVGSINADEFVVNFLGLTSTEEVVTSATPNLLQSSSELPAVGTVFSVTNTAPWNTGVNDEIYLATPTTSATDTTVTSLGTSTTAAPFNLDAVGTGEINPASIFANLVAEQAPQDASIPPPLLGAPATDAFTINGITFYPETSSLAEGYNNMAQTLGAAPLIAAFGGSAEGISLAPQDFFYYTGTGASAHLEGELSTSMTALDILSFSNASFTVTGCADVLCTDAPANGTVFDVFNLGGGIENVYEGTPDGTVTDTLWTAFGPLINFIIPSLDAAVPLSPLDVIPAGFDVPLL